MTAQLAICSPCLMNPVLHTLAYEHLPVGLKSPPVPRKWLNFFFFSQLSRCVTFAQARKPDYDALELVSAGELTQIAYLLCSALQKQMLKMSPL